MTILIGGIIVCCFTGSTLGNGKQCLLFLTNLSLVEILDVELLALSLVALFTI